MFCNEIIDASDLRSHQFDQHKYRLPEVGKSAFLKYIRKEKIPVSVREPGRIRKTSLNRKMDSETEVKLIVSN